MTKPLLLPDEWRPNVTRIQLRVGRALYITRPRAKENNFPLWLYYPSRSRDRFVGLAPTTIGVVALLTSCVIAIREEIIHDFPSKCGRMTA